MIKDKGHGSEYEGLKVFSSCDVRAETLSRALWNMRSLDLACGDWLPTNRVQGLETAADQTFSVNYSTTHCSPQVTISYCGSLLFIASL